MRRLALVLLPVLLLLVLAACNRSEEPDEAAGTPTQTSSPTPTHTPPPSPIGSTPLTGRPLFDEDADVLERGVLAVKIDNVGRALPQQGLDDADIVLEELVEGGATRFIALYQSTDPGVVGPVRSGRAVDADVLPPFDPVLGISGAAAPTYEVLHGAGLRIFEEGQAGGAFFRERERPSPHNLFASAEGLWAAAEDLPAAERPWPINSVLPGAGERIASARLSFSPAMPVRWNWDEEAEAWAREQAGRPHRNADREQITAENVVVARVQVRAGGGIDVAGSRTAEIEVVGEGALTVLRDGRVYEGRWRREGRDAHFAWINGEGRAIPLAPGRTWIELLPGNAPLALDPR